MEKRELIATCRLCKTEHILEVNPLDLIDWENGKHIQSAMPYLAPGERKLLISGTCEDCFHKMFAMS